MAPSYENLPIDDDEFDDEQIDFTDLEDQYQVRLDEGLDTFVVVDGLPKVPDENKPKLIKFILRKLNSVGKVKYDGVFMPLNEETGQTEGYVFKMVGLE
jgi:translation initiation factor 3 subunit B